MLKKLLAIVLLLHIGLIFAQNSKPNSPFSFDNQNGVVNTTPKIVDAMPNIAINADNNIVNNSINTNVQTNSLTTASLDIPEAKKKEYLNNLAERIVNPIKNKWEEYGKSIIKSTIKLFLYLSGFAVLWRFIKFIVRGQYDFGLWLLDTVFMIVVVKLMIAFISNADVVSLNVINIFRDIAKDANGVAEIKPSMLLELAQKYFGAVAKFVQTFSLQDLLKGLILISIAGGTWFGICLLVCIYVVAIIQAIIQAKVSIIFLAFQGVEKLSELSIRPILQWINIGIKLMLLQLMIGMQFDIINDFIKLDEINLYMALSVSTSTLIMLVLSWTLPKIFDNLITGQVSMSDSAAHTLKRAANSIKDSISSMTLGTAKNVGGAYQAIKAQQNYQAAQQAYKNQAGSNSINSSNFSTSNTANTPIFGTSNNKNSTSNSIQSSNTSTTGNLGNSNNSNNANNTTPLNNTNSTKSINTATTASNNINDKNISSNSIQSSNINPKQTNSSLQNSVKQPKASTIAGLAKSGIDMGKQTIKNSFAKTAGGRLAQHIDSKTQEIQKQTMQAAIDNHYKEMWSKTSEVDKNVDSSNNVTNTIEKFNNDNKDNK